MKKVDRIINNLREVMTANSPGESGGFSADSKAEGPTAGYDPLMYFSRRRKNPDMFDLRSIPKKYRKWVV
jgi:hypothetical protein